MSPFLNYFAIKLIVYSHCDFHSISPNLPHPPMFQSNWLCTVIATHYIYLIYSVPLSFNQTDCVQSLRPDRPCDHRNLPDVSIKLIVYSHCDCASELSKNISIIRMNFREPPFRIMILGKIWCLSFYFRHSIYQIHSNFLFPRTFDVIFFPIMNHHFPRMV